MGLGRLGAALLTVLGVSAADAALPSRAACPMLGATYLPQGRPAAGERRYRLRVEALPSAAAGSAVATLWRFQTLAATGATVLGELRMYYSCPNGAGACSVSPPSRPGPEGGLYSEVVALNRDFSPATGMRAPYALILPGFGSADWTFTRAELQSRDLSFATVDKITPDLSDAPVWLLSSCGRK